MGEEIGTIAFALLVLGILFVLEVGFMTGVFFVGFSVAEVTLVLGGTILPLINLVSLSFEFSVSRPFRI